MSTITMPALHLACASELDKAAQTRSPKQLSPVAKRFRRFIPNRDKAFFDDKLLANGKITHWPHVPSKIPKKLNHAALYLAEMYADAIDTTPWDDDE